MLPGLGFTTNRLSVRYRASTTPQRVDIYLTTDRPPEIPYAPLALPFLLEAINLGAGGGAQFSPTVGSARVLTGPVGPGSAADTRYVWQLELAGVCPLFMRLLVERLAEPGPGASVTAMSIVGALPLDETPFSATENQVKVWLNDSSAYPGSWVPQFPVLDRFVSRGAAIRVGLARDVDHDLLLQFTRLIEIWNQVIMTVLNGSAEFNGVADAAPRMSRNRTEIAAGYDAFDFLRVPTKAAFVNMLVRFHEQVAPILEAQIALA